MEVLSPNVGEDTEKIFADIFEHVPFEKIPHFGPHTSFALENSSGELRELVDGQSGVSPYIHEAINSGVGAQRPPSWLPEHGWAVFNAHKTVADGLSFNRRKILLEGVSKLLNGVIVIEECRAEGNLSIGNRSFEMPPKSFFTVALYRYVDFNTDMGRMLSIGYDANSRELMLSSTMASHVDRDACHRKGCAYEARLMRCRSPTLSQRLQGLLSLVLL